MIGKLSKSRGGFQIRTDIQALRALAVLAVFAYHVRPDYLTGGFVGVDVFFVLSGFLISSHLIAELADKGRIEFTKFWSRRAKRLLPASLTVLLVTAVAVWTIAPQALQERFFRDISAATLYVANWVFAFDSVDYLAADNSPSVVQHFWSLGVEEQLYIVWPLLLAIAWLVGAKRGFGTRGLVAILALITSVSFAYSALLVVDGNPVAYFSTLSRAWEFGAGALLAVWAARRPSELATSFGLRHIASWTGWLSLIAFMLFFKASAGFPGVNALIPVLATVLIIYANDPGGRFGPAWLLRLRPIQFLGDASYSIYLWHWPLIIFAGFYFANLPAWMVGTLFVATVLLAALSMKFIENPFRFGKLRDRLTPTPVFAGMATAMLVIVGSTQAAGLYVSDQVAKQEQETAALEAELAKVLDESVLSPSSDEKAPEKVWDEISCMGPAHLVEPECIDFTWDTFVPGIRVAEETAHDVEPLVRIGSEKGCLAWGDEYSLIECVFGVMGGSKTVLIGDSHAYHWLPAFSRVAQQQQLELHFLARAGCSANTAPRNAPGDHVRGCNQWMGELNAWFEQQSGIQTIIIANFAGSRFEGASDPGVEHQPTIEGYIDYWEPLIATGAEVLVMKDTPYIKADAWNCMVNNPEDPTRCDIPREVIEAEFDNSAAAAQALGLRVIDMTSYFCKEDVCPMVVGGVRVYRDSNHMSGTYNLLLTPYLAREIFG